MPSYLIRRRDRFGRFVHVDTVRNPNTEIDESYLSRSYGIGVYTVVVAVEGRRGLTHYGDFIIPPPVDFECYYTLRPTPEQISQEYSTGNYLIAKLSNAKAVQIYEGDEPSDRDIEVFDKLRGYAPALKGWGLFRVVNSYNL